MFDKQRESKRERERDGFKWIIQVVVVAAAVVAVVVVANAAGVAVASGHSQTKWQTNKRKIRSKSFDMIWVIFKP